MLTKLKILYSNYFTLYNEGLKFSTWYVSGTLMFTLFLYFTIPNESPWLLPGIIILCLSHIYISGPYRAYLERKLSKIEDDMND
ncbi:hypothetical protein RH915_11290 [Serpentinicella sp. ANB-PHB4]|uniref:hypothetical protein n=1 Tax=Serpentinicella sp. ANB-PHB4 TaxID=3074076 RepID=UPI002856E437|nr:hypothetical protein [Serpentinicella sp. ANB-PHB4]MDR5660075.1 hypothetical protein [Serpentinicella sp. ANB-PHB4]